MKGDSKKRNDATKEIYGGDEYMTKLAEISVNLQPEEALGNLPARIGSGRALLPRRGRPLQSRLAL
ncbi:MAG TPA: hypothetical protein VF637_07950 [Sphingomicrobium sp.]